VRQLRNQILATSIATILVLSTLGVAMLTVTPVSVYAPTEGNIDTDTTGTTDNDDTDNDNTDTTGTTDNSPSRPAHAQNDISFDNPERIVGTEGEDAEPPQIATSGRNAYIIWHEFPTAADDQPDVFLSRSTNMGQDFGDRRNLSNSPDIDSSDEQIATSGRNVYVVWSENQDEILFTRSNDGGASFRPPETLSDAGGAVDPQIATSGRNVYVVWAANGQAGNTDIFFTQSDDGGRNFENEENISNNDGMSENPDIDLSGNNVIVTWRDNTTPGMDFEIFFTQGE
jgi:hypothetical protein